MVLGEVEGRVQNCDGGGGGGGNDSGRLSGGGKGWVLR